MKKFQLFCLVAVITTTIFGAGCDEKAQNASQSKTQVDKQVDQSQQVPVANTKNATAAIKPEVAIPAAPPMDPKTVMVTINGKDITLADVDKVLAPRLKAMASKMPPQYIDQYKQQFRQKTIESMIVEQLLDAKIAKSNLTISEADFNKQMLEMAKMAGPDMTLEKMEQMAADRGQDFGQIKEQIRKGMKYEMLMEKELGNQINVTDAEVKTYYDQNAKKFQRPETVNASHILISTKSDDNSVDTETFKKQAREKIDTLLKEVKSGKDFAELAKEHSSCPSSARGGNLGDFGKGQMVPAFEQAAFALAAGQVSDIVETNFGYHIIKVNSKNAAKTDSFDEAKEKIKEALKRQKQSQLAQSYIQQLRDEAKIVYPKGSLMAPAKAPVLQ